VTVFFFRRQLAKYVQLMSSALRVKELQKTEVGTAAAAILHRQIAIG
jgi:hypothetical protein